MTNYLENIKNDKFEIRLCQTDAELDAVQRLRYDIFFIEEGAIASPEVKVAEKDFDYFDDFCSHLIVVDKMAGDKPKDYIIGTYRLLMKEGAKQAGRWYSQTEFNVEQFNNYDGEVLELGRACVKKEYRNKTVMQMLWNGLAAYMFDNNIKLMFGCGSFLGTNPLEYKQALSCIYYNHLLDNSFDIDAKGENKREYPLIPKEEVDIKKAFSSLPTLLKAYLRVGCQVSKSLYIDWDFNCFDVLIVFETKNLKQSYLDHYTKTIIK